MQKPAVVVSNLRKKYKGRREGFSLSKTRTVATRNISFCVRKGRLGSSSSSSSACRSGGVLTCAVSSGEVLGLLGPNGAGKSTVMQMLSGDTEPSAGQVRTAPVFYSVPLWYILLFSAVKTRQCV